MARSRTSVRHLFLRLWVGPRGWSDRLFELHYVPDQIEGVMYAGVTVFGYSLLYSDTWGR